MAGATREQTRPAAPVEHADARAHRGRRCGAARRRAPRRAARARVARRAGRPPRRAATPRLGTSTLGGPIAATASTVGAGVSTRTAAPTRAGTFERDVARVPRRRALVLQRLVAFVEHDHRRRSGTGAHTALRPPITTHAPGSRPRPVRAAHGVGVLRSERHHLAPFALRATARAAAGASPRDRSPTSTPPASKRYVRGSPAARWRASSASRERRARIHRGLDSGASSGAHDVGRRRGTRGSWPRVPPTATRPSDRGRPRRAAARPTTPRAPRAGRSLRAARRRRRRPSRAPAGRAAGRARWCPPRRARRACRGGGSRTPGGWPGRRAGPGEPPAHQARDSAAFLSASAWSVRSHVKSRSLRPKCP